MINNRRTEKVIWPCSIVNDQFIYLWHSFDLLLRFSEGPIKNALEFLRLNKTNTNYYIEFDNHPSWVYISYTCLVNFGDEDVAAVKVFCKKSTFKHTHSNIFLWRDWISGYALPSLLVVVYWKTSHLAHPMNILLLNLHTISGAENNSQSDGLTGSRSFEDWAIMTMVRVVLSSLSIEGD